MRAVRLAHDRAIGTSMQRPPRSIISQARGTVLHRLPSPPTGLGRRACCPSPPEGFGFVMIDEIECDGFCVVVKSGLAFARFWEILGEDPHASALRP